MSDFDTPYLIVPLTSYQVDEWNAGRSITVNPAMQSGPVVEAIPLSDALSYYQLADYGFGGIGPQDAEDAAHKFAVDRVVDAL